MPKSMRHRADAVVCGRRSCAIAVLTFLCLLPALAPAFAQGTQPRLTLWKVQYGKQLVVAAEVDDPPTGPLGAVEFKVSDKTATRPLTTPGAGQATIAAGSDHVCVITSARGVKCWGKNDKGQLGNGTTTDSSTPVDVKQGTAALAGVVAIAAGDKHTCAIMASDRSVKCWGNNDKGQLGNGSTAASANTAADVALTDVVAISAGAAHTCALMRALSSNTRVKCWGSDAAGQIGDGDCAIPDEGTATCIGGYKRATATGKSSSSGSFWRRERSPTTKTPIDAKLATYAPIAIATGGNSVCAQRYFGSQQGVDCWGRVAYSETSVTSPSSELTADLFVTRTQDPKTATRAFDGQWMLAAVGKDHVCAATADGGVSCKRDFVSTAAVAVSLTAPDGPRLAVRRAQPMALSASRTGAGFCALLSDRVSCWTLSSDNPPVVLPSARSPDVSRPKDVKGPDNNLLSDAVAIAVGGSGSTNCAIRRSGGVVCWSLPADGSAIPAATAVANVTAAVRARATLALEGVAADAPVTASLKAGTATLTASR